jgi:hypothetical protein
MVTERRNQLITTEATLMQQVISSALSGEQGRKLLMKSLGRLNVETVPHGLDDEGAYEGQ